MNDQRIRGDTLGSFLSLGNSGTLKVDCELDWSWQGAALG